MVVHSEENNRFLDGIYKLHVLSIQEGLLILLNKSGFTSFDRGRIILALIRRRKSAEDHYNDDSVVQSADNTVKACHPVHFKHLLSSPNFKADHENGLKNAICTDRTSIIQSEKEKLLVSNCKQKDTQNVKSVGTKENKCRDDNFRSTGNSIISSSANTDSRLDEKTKTLSINEVKKIRSERETLAKTRDLESGSAKKLFVKNISFKVKPRELWRYFEYYGKVKKVDIARFAKTNRSRGFGFVEFEETASVEKVLNANKWELIFDGRKMDVAVAMNRKEKKKNLSSAKPVQCTHEPEHKTTETIEEKLTDYSPTTCDMFSWADIPGDVLLQCMDYLNMKEIIQLELVCRTWNEIARSYWSTLKYLHFQNIFRITSKNAGLTDEILMNIIRKGCNNIKSLDFSASPFLIGHAGLKFVADRCQKIEELDLTAVNLDKKSLQVLGKNLTSLKKVRMLSCQTVGEKSLWWFLKDLKQLESLNLSGNSRITGKCFYLLPESLKSMVIPSCSSLVSDGLVNLSRRCPKLTELNISNCPKTTSGFQTFCQNSSGLKKLNISNMITYGFTQFESLRSLVNITHLDISRNSLVVDENLRIIALSCRKLQYLSLEACHGNITCAGIYQLVLLPCLKDVNLSYIVKVCDSCLECFAYGSSFRTLKIRACQGVSTQGFFNYIMHNECLEEIDVSSCEGITNFTISECQEMGLRNSSLKMIIGGTSITEEGVERLRQFSSSLELHLFNKSNRDMRKGDSSVILSRPFYPEEEDSDDEDDQDNVDDDVTDDVIDDVIFRNEDFFDDWFNYGDDDERPWEVFPPSVEGDVEERLIQDGCIVNPFDYSELVTDEWENEIGEGVNVNDD